MTVFNWLHSSRKAGEFLVPQMGGIHGSSLRSTYNRKGILYWFGQEKKRTPEACQKPAIHLKILGTFLSFEDN